MLCPFALSLGQSEKLPQIDPGANLGFHFVYILPTWPARTGILALGI